MKKYSLLITQNAKNDLREIFSYIANNDSTNDTNTVMNKLEKYCYRLQHLPERGKIVPEMRSLGIKDFREIQCKPFRIIYEVKSNKVIIISILDSRRNLDDLLKSRLLHYNT